MHSHSTELFEHKMSNTLDKPLKSIFGYIAILPSAFSMYRYIALQNNALGKGPLQNTFLVRRCMVQGQIYWLQICIWLKIGCIWCLSLSLCVVPDSNEYSLLDPLLEPIWKCSGSWILDYVKSMYAVTDVPNWVPELTICCSSPCSIVLSAVPPSYGSWELHSLKGSLASYCHLPNCQCLVYL